MTMWPAPVQQEAAGRAGSLLGEARQLIESELRLAVAGVAEPTRRVIEYHLGWTDADGRAYTRPAGKGIRGALVLACVRAAGGLSEAATVPAAAIELVHNFSLLHDDLMDHDALRRGVPTAWAVFGEPAALLAGDAMLALAFSVVAGVPEPHLTLVYLGQLCRAMQDLVAGQGADMAFETRHQVRPEEYLAMAAGKTGGLMAAGCAMGAIAAGATSATVTALRTYGLHLGVAFQIADDLLGLAGDPEQTGKPVGTDVARRKKTLPAIAALAGRSVASQRLAQLYGADRGLAAVEVDEATQLIEVAGGTQVARAEMRRHAQWASDALDSMPTGQATGDLRAILTLATRRSW
jgi:geranylgeranyl diphosphate synthase, type I